jgi:hypothetical protein
MNRNDGSPLNSKRGRTAVWAFLAIACWFVPAAAARSQDNSALVELNDSTDKTLSAAEVFSQVPQPIGLAQEQNKSVLLKILSPKLEEFLVIDTKRVEQHFANPAEKKLADILQPWKHGPLDTEQYVSIPFFIDVQADSGKLQFVISDKILTAPASVRARYLGMLRAYAALPKSLARKPSGWTHGLCSLAAVDMLAPNSLANLPDLEIETATAALLLHGNEELLTKPYLEPEERFDPASYGTMLRSALQALGSANPDKALEELSRSPEEYHAISQAQIRARQEAPEDQKPFLPPVHPAMVNLWRALPDQPEDLRRIADSAAERVRNSALRLVVLNACYDKLCAVVIPHQSGTLTDAAILMRNHLQGYLKESGMEVEPLLDEFKKRQQEALKAFEDDLAARPQDADEKHPGIAFDPAALKWTFRFLYNYSLPVREQEMAFREELKKSSPGGDGDLDKLVVRELEANPKLIERWWAADPFIARLFELVGKPIFEIKKCDSTQSAAEVTGIWSLKRRGTGDVEEVRIRIIDPLSSGGGQPIPGVSALAKVVVRKTLDSPPEVIELKHVQPNFYIQSVDHVSDTDKNGKPQERHQDWARVLKVKTATTKSPWQIASGGPQPLDIGRKQMVRTRLGGGNKEGAWEWSLPLPITADRDHLLAIEPTGVIPAGQTESFPAAAVSASTPLTEQRALVELMLSHREIGEIRESAATEWGYFADSRMVMAQVVPAPLGVEGEAVIEMPGSSKPLQAIESGTEDQPRDKVHAFEYRSPETFVDVVLGNESKQIDFMIDIGFRLPSGEERALRVAEGQEFVVFDRERKTLQDMQAYQLTLGSELVCSFLGAQGFPETARVTRIKGVESPLGVYRMLLKQCELVRANGVLVKMDVEPTVVYAGVAHDSLVPMAEPLDVVRKASEDQIDLAGLKVKRAGEIGKVDAKPRQSTPKQSTGKGKDADRTKSGGGEEILSYNALVQPRSFWNAQISRVEDATANRYVRVVTPNATLICGHLQEIYVTETDWSGLKELQASMIVPGKHQVVWLCAASEGREWTDRNDAEKGLRAAVEGAFSRLRSRLPAPAGTAAAGRVSLVPVTAVQEMHATEQTPFVPLREFVATDSRIARLGLRPTLFADGILVKIRFEHAGPKGEGPGERGASKSPSKVGDEPNPGPSQPSYHGVNRDLPADLATVEYSGEDLVFFAANKRQLAADFTARQPHVDAIRQEVLTRFLSHYFSNPPSATDAYASGGLLAAYFADYGRAREYLVTTGDARVLPAVYNSYLLTATLLYEADERSAGDSLTRDFLCLSLRTLNRAKDGRELYRGSQRVPFGLRSALMATRDMLAFVRGKSDGDGFGPVAACKFPADTFLNVLNGKVEAGRSFVEFGCSPDIADGKNVSLYNLCRQLDQWSKSSGTLLETIVAPGFKVSGLYSDGAYREKLGTRVE